MQFISNMAVPPQSDGWGFGAGAWIRTIDQELGVEY
jgi:hypothetical protein